MISLNQLVAPLSIENCNYFSILSLFCLGVFLAIIIVGIFQAKKNNILATVITSLSPLLGYYVNRLMFSMCINSLQ